jgi:hypothetical protein
VSILVKTTVKLSSKRRSILLQVPLPCWILVWSICSEPFHISIGTQIRKNLIDSRFAQSNLTGPVALCTKSEYGAGLFGEELRQCWFWWFFTTACCFHSWFIMWVDFIKYNCSQSREVECFCLGFWVALVALLFLLDMIAVHVPTYWLRNFVVKEISNLLIPSF